jgi:hypothetical protein
MGEEGPERRPDQTFSRNLSASAHPPSAAAPFRGKHTQIRRLEGASCTQTIVIVIVTDSPLRVLLSLLLLLLGWQWSISLAWLPSDPPSCGLVW